MTKQYIVSEEELKDWFHEGEGDTSIKQFLKSKKPIQPDKVIDRERVIRELRDYYYLNNGVLTMTGIDQLAGAICGKESK